MAREAGGFGYVHDAGDEPHKWQFTPTELKAFEALVRADERALAAPVQEPVAWIEHHKGGDNLEWDNPGGKCTPLYTTPPAQPAPVLEGRDWSLLEATQESLREHMAEIKRLKEAQPAVPLTDEMRKQMKERCDSMEMRGAFADGWLSAEAAHGITKGQP